MFDFKTLWSSCHLAIFKVTHKVTHDHIWYSVGFLATPCCVFDSGIHCYITWALIKFGGAFWTYSSYRNLCLIT